MADTPKHSVSVAGIVVDDQDRVLVIQRRDNGHWEPPGGVLELVESPTDGVIREVLEETGVQVRVEQLTGVYKNMVKGVISLVFRCTPIGGQVSSSIETKSVRWLPKKEATSLMREAYSIRVFDALRTLPSSTPVRSHNGESLLADQSESVES